MDSLDFYNDKKWCASCANYVPYLMSIEHSFCITCGAEVRLFSEDDWRSFSDGMEQRKTRNAGKRGEERVVKRRGPGRESA
ncbi:MAG: hypothetical protein R3F49_23670 [Planctomycetota bacterium]